MSQAGRAKTPGARKALTTLTLKDPKRFVPGETYRLLLGHDRQQRYINLMCTRQGELDLSVLEIQEHSSPEITFCDKQICFRNPHFQANYRPIKKIVLARFTLEELVEDIPGVTYDAEFEKALMAN